MYQDLLMKKDGELKFKSREQLTAEGYCFHIHN